MQGAIPYFKIQEEISKEEKKAMPYRPGSAGASHLVLCGMAHQVNNLLMRLQGWTSLMLLDVAEGASGYNRLKRVEREIEYGGVLTSQLLACAGRGVYADPVNIPPLLLATEGSADVEDGENRTRTNLFIVAAGTGQVRPGLLRLCREITAKITGLFSGIDKILSGASVSQLEKQYRTKIRQVTTEGTRLAHNAAAGFEPGSGQAAFAHPQRKKLTARLGAFKLSAGF